MYIAAVSNIISLTPLPLIPRMDISRHFSFDTYTFFFFGNFKIWLY